jgi:hypothetical protein
MNVDAFIKAFYIKSAWTEEEALLPRRGFVSAAVHRCPGRATSRTGADDVRFLAALALGRKGNIAITPGKP